MKYYVNMTDKFMSGWGPATGKVNKYCVECDTLDQAEQIERAAHQRSEMKHINICSKRPQPKANQLYSWKHYDDLGGCWKS